MAQKHEVKTTDTPDFQNLVNLLAVYSEASNRLAELQADVNRQTLELIDEHKPEYAALQETLAKSEASLEMISREHPEWFGPRAKSLKTPYGIVKFHASTKLEIPNEEATLLLIERELERDPEFPKDAIRTSQALNLEALERLDDSTLKRLRVTRVPNDNFSVKPATIDLGKAVKDAAPAATAQAA